MVRSYEQLIQRAGWRVLPTVTSITACLTEPDNETTSRLLPASAINPRIGIYITMIFRKQWTCTGYKTDDSARCFWRRGLPEQWITWGRSWSRTSTKCYRTNSWSSSQTKRVIEYYSGFGSRISTCVLTLHYGDTDILRSWKMLVLSLRAAASRVMNESNAIHWHTWCSIKPLNDARH